MTVQKPSVREPKAVSYARLAKLDVFDYYIGLLVVLSAIFAVSADAVVDGLPMLAVFALGEVFMIAAMVAFDDLTGFRDGSDIANYGPDTPRRRMRRKPLVAGTLTEREAWSFGWITAAIGAVVLTVAVLIAPHAPLWTILLTGVTFVVSLQYSYGIKLSYHGFQELFIAALGWALVLAPYGLATGRFDGFVLVQALLFGMGPLLFGVYSNTNDVKGDRAVGRPTVAARTSPRGNALFVGAVSATEFLLGAIASLTGIAPWWFVLLMLPITVLRVRQYRTGFADGDILRARTMGFTIHRTSVALLVAANLVHAFTA